ncbi:MAG: methylated-DNA--[protein]-cysteine S-methyltransferase [Nocardioides sp.]
MWTLLDSPVGELRIIAGRGAITAIEFEESVGPVPTTTSAGRAAVRASGRPVGERSDDDALLAEARRQLAAYFARELKEFDLPLQPDGTDFQRSVWQQLCEIAYGETISYGELARRLGKSAAASRAVGTANGANPIPIVIPCHRVIGADGSLTGYAGGLDRKQVLLGLEQESLF